MSLRANPMPTSPEHQPVDQSLLDTDILSELDESIDPLIVRNASVQSRLASNCGRRDGAQGFQSAKFLVRPAVVVDTIWADA